MSTHLKRKTYNVGLYESVLDTSRHVQCLRKRAKLVTCNIFFYQAFNDYPFLGKRSFKHFNSLCTGVDLYLILKFIQRIKLLLILMFTKMTTETRKSTIQYVIRSKLFSACGCRSITHSASICLMTHFRCRQLCHTPSIQVIPGNEQITSLPIRKLPEVSSNGQVS